MEMKTFAQYVEEIKTLHGLTSNYQVAKALMIDTKIIGEMLKGNRHPPAHAAYRIADLLGLEHIDVRACLDYEFSKDEQGREYIKGVFLRKWRDVAATVLIAISMLAGGKDANASTPSNKVNMDDVKPYYANYCKSLRQGQSAGQTMFLLWSYMASHPPGWPLP